MKRKIVPILYVILLYVFPAMVFIFNTFDFNPQMYFPFVLAGYFINIYHAFWLYGQKDVKNLKFSMCLTTFGLIPYYLMMILVVMILIGLMSGRADMSYMSTVFLACMVVLWLVLFSNAFYGFNFARIKKLKTKHMILPFISVLNVIDCIVVLLQDVSRETIETKKDIL